MDEGYWGDSLQLVACRTPIVVRLPPMDFVGKRPLTQNATTWGVPQAVLEEAGEGGISGKPRKPGTTGVVHPVFSLPSQDDVSRSCRKIFVPSSSSSVLKQRHLQPLCKNKTGQSGSFA